jgi:hypothetical protein
LLTSLVARLIGNSMFSYLVSGLFVSNMAFLAGMVGFMRLIGLDYEKNTVRKCVILLLLFPTSFYFGAFYSESLFFALSVWSFYFARKGKWLYAGVLGAALTATRIVGLALIPALLVEVWLQNGKPRIGDIKEIRKIWGKRLLGIALIPVGIIGYMVYLNKVAGDPLEFFHNVFIYGEQRSSEIIMLPQVFYRYIFKILPNINYDYFPAVFTTWLEFVVGLGVGVLGGLGAIRVISKLRGLGKSGRFEYFEIRESYLVYLLAGYLIPTLSGSFSSLPRYVVVLFPVFIMLVNVLNKSKNEIRKAYYILSALTLLIASMLFSRGYWIA